MRDIDWHLMTFVFAATLVVLSIIGGITYSHYITAHSPHTEEVCLKGHDIFDDSRNETVFLCDNATTKLVVPGKP